MKAILFFALTLSSFSALALPADRCAKYNHSERYMRAIKTVADYTAYGIKEMCSHPMIWDVEAQPSRIIEHDGTVIPHVRVQLHREYDSCLYMVRDADQVITSARCYSAF